MDNGNLRPNAQAMAIAFDKLYDMDQWMRGNVRSAIEAVKHSTETKLYENNVNTARETSNMLQLMLFGRAIPLIDASNATENLVNNVNRLVADVDSAWQELVETKEVPPLTTNQIDDVINGFIVEMIFRESMDVESHFRNPEQYSDEQFGAYAIERSHFFEKMPARETVMRGLERAIVVAKVAKDAEEFGASLTISDLNTLRFDTPFALFVQIVGVAYGLNLSL